MLPTSRLCLAVGAEVHFVLVPAVLVDGDIHTYSMAPPRGQVAGEHAAQVHRVLRAHTSTQSVAVGVEIRSPTSPHTSITKSYTWYRMLVP